MKKQLETMKETLMCCAQGQMGNLSQVDAKELGEVIDMIKDLEEAIYYCTITEAMNSKEKEKEHHHYYTPYLDRDMDRDHGKMYYTDDRMYYDGNYRMGGRMHYGDGGMTSSGNGGNSGTRHYTEKEISMIIRDPREGRSYQNRKMYMESKEMHKDKATQLKELEKYMQELTQDMVEMIEDASPEEKQYLEKRITALGSKIGSLNGQH